MSAENTVDDSSLPSSAQEQIVEIVRKTPSFYPPEDPVLGETNNDVVASDLPSLLNDSETTLAICAEADQVTGFSLAVPIGRMDKTRQEDSTNTAYIYYTAIRPELRGNGLVGPLMEKMYTLLRERGYSFVERDSVLAGGWADNVEKNSQGAILASHEHDKWGLGRERFFRMDLEKLGVEQPR